MKRSEPAHSTCITPIGQHRTTGLVITGVRAEALLDVARIQRASSDHGYFPLFAERVGPPPTGQVADELELLLDGYAESPATALVSAQRFWDQAGVTDVLPDETPQQRLLSYLLLRTGQTIRPLKDWQAAAIYRYPLLEAFGADAGGALLPLLAHRGVLARRQLIERLRLCPSCGGAHMLYVDICPNCHQRDIQRDQSIHCFACGYVESEGSFRASGVLLCPNCRTRLRQIGTDYDRPLEHFQCHACGERFVDPEVIARCGICDQQTHPEQLVTREVGTYELTEYGRVAARSGVHELGPGPREDAGYLRPAFFEQLLDWQRAVAQHHTQARFTLLLLRLLPRDASGSSGGYSLRFSRLLHDLGERLPEITRPSDICARTREGEFWVLMPQSGPADARRLIETLEELVRSTPYANDALDCQARMLDSSGLRSDELNANSLMQQLLVSAGGQNE